MHACTVARVAGMHSTRAMSCRRQISLPGMRFCARCLVRTRALRTEVTDRNRDRDERTWRHLTSTEETGRKVQTHRPKQALARGA